MIKFGGVPIGVMVPPMLAAYAMPNKSRVANILSFCVFKIAIAMGSNINVVAVLEIHMLNKKAVNIKPTIIFFGLFVPTFVSIL